MSTLINDLLDYSRLSVDALFEPTDLNETLTDIITDLEYFIKEKQAVFHVSSLPVIETIPPQMRQVFQNLVVNALKFSQPGIPPVITIRSERTSALSADSPADDAGSYCRILFSDNGIGFDEKYIDKIFTLFQRLNDRNKYEGTGIGLAIAKKIITKHNGIITARSSEGEGASFIIVLPVQQPSAKTS